MKRVIVIGSSCSGKTTLACRRRNYRALFASGAFPNICLTELRRPVEAEAFLSAFSADGWGDME